MLLKRNFPPSSRWCVSASPTTTSQGHFLGSFSYPAHHHKPWPLSWQLFLSTNIEEGGKELSHGKEMSMVVGPWGGDGGTSWDDGSYSTGVREIMLVYDRCIDRIRVVYDKKGKPVSGHKHGGVGGNKTAEIKLQFPEEKLIGVSGHYCQVVHGGSPVIRSLTFRSSQRTFGPFGVEEGTPFSLSIDRGQIVGFLGRSGWYLDAIGFYVSHTRPSSTPFQAVQRKLRKLANMAISASKDPGAKLVKENKSISQ